MPALFPEVFSRDRAGFDVLVGNPPWEKLHVEEHQWWGLRMPGLRGLDLATRKRRLKTFQNQHPELVAEYEKDIEANNLARSVIAAGPYLGIGSGHIDLYKAFAWRNFQLICSSGCFGVVLPRSALNGAGTQEWRKTVIASGAFKNVVTTINTGGWVFENIHGQYATAFVVGFKASEVNEISFVGPFSSLDEFEQGREDLAVIGKDEFLGWSRTATFPSLPSRRSVVVFRKFRQNRTFGETYGS